MRRISRKYLESWQNPLKRTNGRHQICWCDECKDIIDNLDEVEDEDRVFPLIIQR